MKGNINSIETMGLVDGPGIRFVFFMQGCSLRCLFCHNPETWASDAKILMTPIELVTKALKFKNYFNNDGGITFSGGEPLLQPVFLLETLKLCKQVSINTCLDTSGYGMGNYEEILNYTDLVIYDIKALNNVDHLNMTGKDIKESLSFLATCQKLNKRMWIRQVIIPGLNDNKEYILKLKEYISKLNNIEKVELIPYHTLGVSKYNKLDIPYRLDGVEAMNQIKLKELNDILIS